ncbi:MAG: RNA-binding protein [Candidatus Raymondbacteria bacterium RifOxyC12_full_50_8]|uniref:RNA-binding protein n=1 Tax=Candidatus Raymondbacteria bacterium RIFOXYD12_FULL_49_13 TaxID=1817890 RepID=A0A1F7FFC1_UNCRA|nr:MAG: RNA-binding protein [Candidatus Raymondbacteria bacterium RIFOXYA2_FULL_49_16]OGK01044.1 MAG: RNA-binding protein [Candidatus Raymondbacteria bacterium RifOxyB12_full_50_8]OGK03394.1 MAG: RNA-binding protein [Candidatus Raymondbacteria bacterium RifOxyC12_full_50_8]OGK05399.1 MAG: RNA-binding protein [Candidatus Raymondbacteria bacterium RIFOXYD12_FULL_49_13]OGP43012.1 MAG: RNA-binding protein [Candidatus Raymondbacteria bacterium RIFOXYB2_FULL_49_35]
MSTKLYVGNLPFTATEDEVKGLFGQYGEVLSVNIIKDRITGKPRGFCFVEMENGADAIAKSNGSELGGRNLRVNEARERNDGQDRPR